MVMFNLVRSAAWLAVLGTASALPNLENLNARQPIDADLVVPTTTDTSLAVPTLASPDNTHMAGHEFAVCHNLDGDYKPFCLPKHNETFNPGVLKYITWDPAFFSHGHTDMKANHTVKIIGFYLTPESDTHQAFDSGEISCAWGFYQWPITQDLINANPLWNEKPGNKDKHFKANTPTTITLRMAALPEDGSAAEWHQGPTVQIIKPKKIPNKSDGRKHPADDQVLYVALPTVSVFVLLIVVSTLCCNRGVRRIDLGNVMSRSRRSERGTVGRNRRDRGQYSRLDGRDMELGRGIGEGSSGLGVRKAD
ncbi:hypothetical protein B0T21DRAFT_389201 [Apiosordaria backusii]|uniref:Uncharacterized protein n=1 Tax=Apiosordaria backusii TaxID=314023 RepID=A0AA40K715_9PEZI|nr:hypothetical protein B0T21DRAFT_389201 [Apiosordaria backusii]